MINAYISMDCYATKSKDRAVKDGFAFLKLLIPAMRMLLQRYLAYSPGDDWTVARTIFPVCLSWLRVAVDKIIRVI